MKIDKLIKLSILILACCVMSCARVDEQQNLSLISTGNSKNGLGDRFEIASVLNKSPRVLIAKPKKKKRKAKSSKNLFARFIAGTQTRNDGGEFEKDPSIEPGRAGPGQFEGLLSGVIEQNEDNSDETEELIAELSDSDIVLPVAASAYGKGATVLKSVNGGFGILLLNQGHHHNMLACEALFRSLPIKSNNDIQTAADNQQGLFRPTYWLDKRSGPDKIKQANTEIASVQPLLYLTTASNNQEAKLQNTNLTSSNKSQSSDCSKKVEYYNYQVSHKLIKRLGLMGRPGPFLAGWRDDGQKAMVLDLSLFNNKTDYDKAMSVWIKLIVRHPELWEAGVVKNVEFKKKVSPLFNKGKQPIMALLKPQREKK